MVDPALCARRTPGLIAGSPSPQEAAEAKAEMATTVWTAPRLTLRYYGLEGGRLQPGCRM